MEKVFNKWCEQLLDTGKGNRLINFKDVKLRTIDVLSPDSTELLKRVSGGDKLTFYDVDSYVKVLREQLTSEDDITEFEREKLNKYKIQNTLSKFLTRKQLLAYKQSITLHSLLRNIKKTAQDYIIEKGINILYLTFGLLCWRENEDVDEWFNSPLVLIPVTIDYNPQDKIYSIKEYEDEIVTNPTLLYKLKSEYNLDLPEFRQAEFENETLAEYLVRVQGYVETNNWFVKDEMKIGTFSFMKLDMYKDLKENQNKILKKPIIQKLLNKPEVKEKQEEEINDEVFGEDNAKLEDLIEKEDDEQDKIFKNLELKLHNVVDADSSQMNAIFQAKSGESFVLQGPPGSGKSQTITNLIAEFLNDGKKILFVSEKLAALNVVYNNLRKVGLSDFCLELHSNKTNKKEVINELYKILGQNKKSVNSSAKFEVEELERYKEQLDKYTEILHTEIPNLQKTPFEIFGIISENKEIPIFEYVLPLLDTRDIQYLNEALDLLKLFIKYSEFVGYDYRVNTWAGFNHFDLTYQSKVELKNNFTNFIDYFENLQNVVNIVNENLEISIENLESMDKYLDFIRVVSKLEFFDSNIFRKEELSKIIIQIGIYLKTKEQYEIKKSKVLERYTEEIFNLDIDTLYQAYSDKYNKWYRFLKSGYKKDKKIIQGYQVKKFNKYSYYDVLEYLDIAKETILLKKKLDDDLKAVISLLNNQEITDFNFEKVNQELLKLDEVLNFKVEVFEEITKEEFEEIKLNLQKMLEFYDENQEKRLEIEVLQNSFDINKIKLYTMNFDEILKKLNDCLDNFDKLENWNRFSGITQKLEKLDLMEFVDKSIDNNIKRETLDLTFKSMFYMQYVYFIIERNEILSSFSRFNQDNAVKNFKSKDKLNFEISKAKIIAKISKNMPDEYSIASGSQVSTLVREANKKIKQKPVRVLFKEIGELVQKLKPCLLMSPLSVSTYLEFGSFNFDVVIFDEASQIFPWDSIGAISRAKQVIVVGDSKQMPPSNFFNAGMVTESEENENEEYEDDALDFESILDLSSAVLKQHRLKWHYRSKTEDLIAFSNANFYENSLVTFPSAYKNRDDMGINFHFVENGIFDRKSKTNKIEAERVVDLVFEHFKTHPDRSLGVVAFSISQQGAIEEAIQERREEFPEYEKFFDDSLVEPLFIKNLETVQGDERDTIIFSVGYARDSAGKFLHNFGPLNKKGGERRLNVAVTRAKYNIKLVASIKSLDIDLAKSSATGTKLLKEYLYIAEHGVDVNKENYTEQNDKHLLENEIYDFLVSKGYKVVKNIGCSEYKIDIGIKHPDNEDFVLAIECDGETYKMAKTTRDRDRLRQEVLERLGWKFYRIWSVDWFLNKPIEKESLLKNVKKAIKFYDDNLGKDKKLNSNSVQLNQEVNENVEDKNFIVETPIEKKDLKSFFDVYEEYDINSKPNPTFYNTIFDLVKKEAPITEELLLKKTVTLFGREKVTTHIRSKFAQEIDKYKEIIFKIDDYYVVNKNMMVKMRIPKEGATPRDIMHIANIELSSGMFVIIKNSVGITEVGLFNATANLLGFSRIGNNIQLKLKESLNILLKNNLVKFVNGEYFVNE